MPPPSSLWEENLPFAARAPLYLPPHNSSAPPPAAAVVIVGGGLTGVSVAYHLAQRGVRSVVVEQRTLAGGATGRNGGILWVNPRDPFEAATVAAMRQAVDLEADCDLTLAGGLNLRMRGGILGAAAADAGGPTGSAEVTHKMQAAGVAAELVDAARSEFVAAAGSCWSAKLVYRLAAAARSHATFLEHVAVEHVARAPDDAAARIVRLSTGQTLRCQHVVLAANAWLPRLVPTLAPHLWPVTNCVLASQRPLPQHLRWHDLSVVVAGDGGPREAYLSQTRNGLVVLGGLRCLAPKLSRGRDDDQRWHAGDSDICAQLRAFYKQTFPQLAAAAPLTQAWVGTLTESADGKPLLGELEPGLYVAGGFNGHGLPRCFGAAAIIARRILGEPLDTLQQHTLAAWDVRRFSHTSKL